MGWGLFPLFSLLFPHYSFLPFSFVDSEKYHEPLFPFPYSIVLPVLVDSYRFSSAIIIFSDFRGKTGW